MSKQIEIKPGERLDDLQLKGLQIIQNPEKFCFGMDAVLLSHFAKCNNGAKMLDMGTGTGIIPIIMAATTPVGCIDALEIQKESADMARRSISLNQLDDTIHIITGDIKEASSILEPSSYDVITTNPPYMNDNHGLKNPDLPKAIARHEILCTLEDVIREGSKLLKANGHFFMIHRPFRLAEIITTLKKYKLEPKGLRLVHPYIDKEPNMVLLEAVKGGNPMIKIQPPLIVYDAPGEYTDEIYRIYGLHKKNH